MVKNPFYINEDYLLINVKNHKKQNLKIKPMSLL